jgi:hypothetical protein
MFVLPSIPDNADEALKDGLAIRNACAVEGRCPDCGAVGVVTADPADPRLFHLTFEHEDACRVLRDDGAT